MCLLRPVDLVCAIDLAGPPEVVRQRRQLIRSLLEILDGEYPEAGRLRVALLSCTDHRYEPGRESRRVVRSTPLGTVSHALQRLGREPGAEIRNPAAAPVEDLLNEAAGLLAASGEGRAARVLLIAGLPHPYPLNRTNVHPCPKGYSWQTELRRLTGYCRASCVAVADSIPRRQDPAAVWRALGQAWPAPARDRRPEATGRGPRRPRPALPADTDSAGPSGSREPMTTTRNSQPGAGRITMQRIGLWGAPGSGKTTYLGGAQCGACARRGTRDHRRRR